MSTPSSINTNKPTTRSSNKKRPSNDGASPVLLTRKRKSSAGSLQEEPLPKRMADNQILEAINGIKTSMSAMEQQLKAAPTKADFGAMINEIKNVKETVIRNKDRIDTLFDLRKEDGALLSKRVEQLVASKFSTAQVRTGQANVDNQKQFLLSRRSVRLWTVQETECLEKGVRRFMTFFLKMPAEVVGSLSFQTIEKQGQSRRSKIQDEVLVRLQTSHQRDIVQSYASNLVSAQGLSLIHI